MPRHVAWGVRATPQPATVAKSPASKSRKAAAAAAAAPVALTFGEQMCAGAVARGVSQTMLHPVDVLRTRLQARGVAMRWSVATLVKGITPQMLLAMPAGAAQFAAFEAAKEKLEKASKGDKRTRELRLLLAGAIGATAAAFFRVPQEVLKQRIQADIYPNLAVAFRETIKDGGVLGLYNGWLATLSRDVPWNALSFMFHGRFKGVFAEVKKRAPADGENLALAGFAGALAAIIMTPVDVVKTRLMTQQAGVKQYSGIVNTLVTIVKEEGAGTLMKGVLPRIVYLAPLAGITFSVYEAFAAIIRKNKMRTAKVAAVSHGKQRLGHVAQPVVTRGRGRRVAYVTPTFSFHSL